MDRTMCAQPVPLLRGGAVIFIHGFSLIAADCRRVQKKIGVVMLVKWINTNLCTYAPMRYRVQKYAWNNQNLPRRNLKK